MVDIFTPESKNYLFEAIFPRRVFEGPFSVSDLNPIPCGGIDQSGLGEVIVVFRACNLFGTIVTFLEFCYQGIIVNFSIFIFQFFLKLSQINFERPSKLRKIIWETTRKIAENRVFTAVVRLWFYSRTYQGIKTLYFWNQPYLCDRFYNIGIFIMHHSFWFYDGKMDIWSNAQMAPRTNIFLLRSWVVYCWEKYFFLFNQTLLAKA